MTKNKIIYVCQSCGYKSPRWHGRCPECEEWNTFQEEIEQPNNKPQGVITINNTSKPTPLSSIELSEIERTKSNIGELDRVLGGGIVKGSIILIGGDPGIGKSTLMLQMCSKISIHGKILYVTGEESIQQTKIRAERLNINSDNLFIFSENNIEIIEKEIKEMKPLFVVIDSVQTIYDPNLNNIPGTVSQIRNITAILMSIAKSMQITIFLIGHITKSGVIAGPKTLEHMVDTVLYFEGDTNNEFRLLRAVKNRFGSCNEIALFEMSDSGLIEVSNPSNFFLSDPQITKSGCTISATLEGTRPILVEIQALTTTSYYGIPQRISKGIDNKKLALLLAVIEKKLGLHLGTFDVFVNITAGMKINEPAIDLGLVLAIYSSFKNIILPKDLFCFGEVGLGGEIRSVSQMERRLIEGEKLGFKKALIPYQCKLDENKLNIDIIKIKEITELNNLFI